MQHVGYLRARGVYFVPPSSNFQDQVKHSKIEEWTCIVQARDFHFFLLELVGMALLSKEYENKHIQNKKMQRLNGCMWKRNVA